MGSTSQFIQKKDLGLLPPAAVIFSFSKHFKEFVLHLKIDEKLFS